MHLSSRLHRQFRLLAVAALVISALAASPTLARGGKVQPTYGQCLVTPNPVTSGVAERFDVIGSGFQPGVQLAVFVGGGSVLMAVTDSTGSFDTWAWAQYPAGTSGTVDVYVYRAGDRHMTVLAHCSFGVV